MAPAENEPDVEEVPEHLRADLEFVFVEHVREVLDAALAPPRAAARAPARARARA